ncbi:hypothetical protein TNCV_2471931 [Trichonephila clavipes]|nr:hypothetical protein TNCV_2471931 [Trichonephila clavipes]
MFEKVFVLFECPTVLSEGFAAIDDDKVYTTQLRQTTTLWSMFKAKKNITEAESDDKNEMNIAAPVLVSSKMKNIMKNMRNYLDATSNG